jgi:hypothetical protein
MPILACCSARIVPIDRPARWANFESPGSDDRGPKGRIARDHLAYIEARRKRVAAFETSIAPRWRRRARPRKVTSLAMTRDRASHLGRGPSPGGLARCLCRCRRKRTIYVEFGRLVAKRARVRFFRHAILCRRNSSKAILPNFGRRFGPIIVRSSGAWFFILTCEEQSAGVRVLQCHLIVSRQK